MLAAVHHPVADALAVAAATAPACDHKDLIGAAVGGDVAKGGPGGGSPRTVARVVDGGREGNVMVRAVRDGPQG